MYVSGRFDGVGVDYAKKRCFRVSDWNVFQNIAVNVNRMNTSSQIRTKFREPRMTLCMTQAMVVTQQTSQARSKLNSTCMRRGALPRYVILTFRCRILTTILREAARDSVVESVLAVRDASRQTIHAVVCIVPAWDLFCL